MIVTHLKLDDETKKGVTGIARKNYIDQAQFVLQ